MRTRGTILRWLWGAAVASGAALAACLVSIPDLADPGAAADGSSPCGADLQRDPRNCGACGKTCDAAQICLSGACASPKLVPSIDHAQLLALSAPYLYVAQRTPPQVLRVDVRAPTTPPVLVAKLQGPATALAVWRGQVLFIVNGALETPLGDAGTIASSGLGTTVAAIAPTSDRLYVANSGNRSINVCSAFDCQRPPSLTNTTGAETVVATADQLFFVTSPPDTLRGCALDGGCGLSRATYRHTSGEIAALAAQGREAWIGTTGTVERAVEDAATSPVVPVPVPVVAMAMDDTHVWAVGGAKLLKITRASGVVETVLDARGSLTDVALGDGVVYVADVDGGVIQAAR